MSVSQAADAILRLVEKSKNIESAFLKKRIDALESELTGAANEALMDMIDGEGFVIEHRVMNWNVKFTVERLEGGSKELQFSGQIQTEDKGIHTFVVIELSKKEVERLKKFLED